MQLKATILGVAAVLISLGVYVVVQASVAAEFEVYPPILVSSIAIIGAELLIIRRIGVISVPSIFWAFVSVPALVPFLSNYVLFTPNYTLRATAYSDPLLIKKGVFLTAVFVMIVSGISILRMESYEKIDYFPSDFVSDYTFSYSLPSFVLVCSVVLIMAYLTTPGPTIITHDYEVARQTYSWASFAGSLFMGSWIVLLFIARQTNRTFVKYVFCLITVVSVFWLLLHARRNESVGVLLTTLVVYGYDFKLKKFGSSLKTTLLGVLLALGIVSQIIVGQIRSGPTNINLRSILIGGSSTGEVVRLPGGGHNIFSTYQFTLHHFAENSYLYGVTFTKYPTQSIPTGVTRIFNITQPTYYFDFLIANYPSYHGGNYLLNEFFANFGSFGIVLAGIFFGVVAAKSNELITNSQNPTLWTGVASVFVIAMPRSTWYWQGNWINVFQGMLVTYIAYLLVLNLTRHLTPHQIKFSGDTPSD